MAGVDGNANSSHILQFCLSLEERLESVEREVQSLKDENLALKIALEEKKSYASAVGDGGAPWKVVATSGTKCKLRRSTVELSNKFDALADEGAGGRRDSEERSVSQGVRCGRNEGKSPHKGRTAAALPPPPAPTVASATTTTAAAAATATTTGPTSVSAATTSSTRKDKSISIVGDSMVRHLGSATCTGVSNLVCLPGAGVGRVLEKIDGIMEDSGDNPIIWLSTGSNDVWKGRTEELLTQYREVLDKIRKKGGIPVVHGILPRRGVRKEWSSRAIGINSRLEKYCKENAIPFLDNWSLFYGKDKLYARDGVHLSRVGVSTLARSLDRIVAGFC